MKNRNILILVLVTGLVVGMFSFGYAETLTLLHTNDIHGVYQPFTVEVEDEKKLVGGMEALAYYVDKVRTEERNVLVIDTGDLFKGTLLSEIPYKSVAGGGLIEFLNVIGYDVWQYGNHAFDYGQKNALGAAQIAEFPTVMANIVYKNTGKLFPVQPYTILEVGALKVGLIGVMQEQFLIEVLKEMVEGLDVTPIIPTLQAYVKVLDPLTDVIVVLLHSGMGAGIKIAQEVGGVDVILVASSGGKFAEENGVLIQCTFGHSKSLGYLQIEVEDDQVIAHSSKQIWLWAEDIIPPAAITTMVEQFDREIAKEYAKVIGEAKTAQTTEGAPVENVLGNWISDVMRWKVGTQIAFHNSGGIRRDLPAGPITKKDVFEISPFGNTLVVLTLSGQQVKDALEYDIERGWDRLQVSGLRYEYSKGKPFGERVLYIEVNGEVLVEGGKILFPEEEYTVVSNNYLIGHAQDKYFGFPVADVRDTGLPLDVAKMDWLETFKVLDYEIENRIVELE